MERLNLMDFPSFDKSKCLELELVRWCHTDVHCRLRLSFKMGLDSLALVGHWNHADAD